MEGLAQDYLSASAADEEQRIADEIAQQLRGSAPFVQLVRQLRRSASPRSPPSPGAPPALAPCTPWLRTRAGRGAAGAPHRCRRGRAARPRRAAHRAGAPPAAAGSAPRLPPGSHLAAPAALVPGSTRTACRTAHAPRLPATLSSRWPAWLTFSRARCSTWWTFSLASWLTGEGLRFEEGEAWGGGRGGRGDRKPCVWSSVRSPGAQEPRRPLARTAATR